MSEFKLVTAKYFDGAEISYYSRNSEIYMTIKQLAPALGYKHVEGLRVSLSRKPHLKGTEFLNATVYIKIERHMVKAFNAKGIREIASLATDEAARVFEYWLKTRRKHASNSPMPKLESFINENFKLEKKIYSTKDIQEITGLSLQRITNKIDSGHLKAVRTGQRQKILIPAWALKEFLESPIEGGIIKWATFFALKKQGVIK